MTGTDLPPNHRDEDGNPASPEAIAEFISARLTMLAEFVQRCQSYFTGSVTVKNTVYWLLQFGSLDNLKLAFRLLEGVEFIDQERLNHLLNLAVSKLDVSEEKYLVFCPIGKPYDSALHISYPFAKQMGLREDFLSNRWTSQEGLEDVLRSHEHPTVVFIDDNCTSGTQFLRFLNELLTDTISSREHVSRPLPPEMLDRFRRASVRFAVGIDLVQKPKFEAEVTERFGLCDFKFIAGWSDYGSRVDYAGGLWRTPAEAARVAQLLSGIARQLFHDKNWPKTLLEDRLLGYGNLGKLTVFAHNIPKSLPPVFWKDGFYNGKRWIPLFPERAIWHGSPETREEREPYMDYFALLIDSGAFGKAAPVCMVELVPVSSEHSATNVIANTSFRRRIESLLLATVKPIEPEPIPQNPPYPGLEAVMGYVSPSQVRQYNREVEDYNQKLPRYVERVREAVRLLSTAVSFCCRIRNTGSAPATEVIIRIELPDGIGFIPRLPEIPDAPERPIRRTKGDMLSSILRAEPPHVATLRQIERHLHPNRQQININQVDDGGRRFIEVRIGKIMQQTFADCAIKYLIVPRPEPYQLYYQLLYSELTRPICGSIELSVSEADTVHVDSVDVVNRALPART